MVKKAQETSVELGYTPSEYQKAIFDFVAHGQGNGVIEAYAGTGKTTTIVSALKFIPKKMRVLYLAFNKANAEDLKNKTASMTNVRVSTSHALGNAILNRKFYGKRLEIDEYKYRTYMKKNIEELSTMFSDVPSKSRSVYFDNISMLVNYARFNIAQSYDEMKAVEKRYNISSIADECEVALKCLAWGKEHIDTIDYTDMLWLPVENQYDPGNMLYDFIFVDECQDIAVVTTRLFLKCLKRGGRLITVGDRKQAIYGFAGASPEAFQFLRDYPNTKLFTLPISYRCGKKIIAEANSLVPEIQARPDAEDGEVVSDCYLSEVKTKDMVLARTKTPLTILYVKLLKQGIPAYIKGAEIGKALIKKIEAVSSDGCENLESSEPYNKDGIIPRLYLHLFDARNKLMDKRGLDYHDATLASSIMDLYDTINTIIVLAAGLETKSQLKRKIEEIFKDDVDNAICLSTVHKAKGFEADNVYILNRSEMPSKLAKEKWELEQEDNLIYIAITRARKKLGYLREDTIKVDKNQNNEQEILSDLMYLENEICELYKKESRTSQRAADVVRKKIENSTKVVPVSEKKEVNTVVLDKPEKKAPESSNMRKFLLSGLQGFSKKK